MFTNQTSIRTTRTARTFFAAVIATALAAAVAVQPAAAQQDPGPSAPTASEQCSLQRVGTQFVSCDDLTGNGVPAPGWVDQR